MSASRHIVYELRSTRFKASRTIVSLVTPLVLRLRPEEREV